MKNGMERKLAIFIILIIVIGLVSIFEGLANVGDSGSEFLGMGIAMLALGIFMGFTFIRKSKKNNRL